MSASASGFVPGSGAGALMLESLDSATRRGAKIYAEVLGGHVNSGGQRNGGSMTAPNSGAVQRCIQEAIKEAGIHQDEIEYINGHLTATAKDPVEIENWCKALGRRGANFPYINSTKSLVGHCLAASGSVESVVAIIQLDQGFIGPSINCEDFHPEIESMIPKDRVPDTCIEVPLKTVAKASFGFGDVNACVIFRALE